MNIFKRIWNWLFGKELRGTYEEHGFDLPLDEFEKKWGKSIESKWIEQKVEKQKSEQPIYYFVHHKMSFKKPQPIGRILTYGKNRFKVHSKITSLKRFKYDLEILN